MRRGEQVLQSRVATAVGKEEVLASIWGRVMYVIGGCVDVACGSGSGRAPAGLARIESFVRGGASKCVSGVSLPSRIVSTCASVAYRSLNIQRF